MCQSTLLPSAIQISQKLKKIYFASDEWTMECVFCPILHDLPSFWMTAESRMNWIFTFTKGFFSKNVSYYFHIHQNQSCCCLFKYFPFLFRHESSQAIFPSFGVMTWKSYNKIRCRTSDIRLSVSVLLGNIISNLISSCWKVYCSINTKFLSN